MSRCLVTIGFHKNKVSWFFFPPVFGGFYWFFEPKNQWKHFPYVPDVFTSLQMGQLKQYLLGLLGHPVHCADPTSYCNWQDNDWMILGYACTYILLGVTVHQCIINCMTSSKAYQLLCHCHEKHSGLTQIQLIQKMMQIQFDNNTVTCETTMALLCNLMYCAERIGHIGITRLALLFTLMNLCLAHPSICEALTPVLMDGSITLKALETHLHYFYEMKGMHGPDLITFPAIAPSPTNTNPMPPPAIALPASIPPCTTLCLNCKRVSHTIEFFIAPGSKLAGQFGFEVSAWQCTAFGGQYPCPCPITNSLSTLLQLDDDDSVWIAGVKYKHELEGTTTAITNVNGAMTAADLGEYQDWANDTAAPKWGSGKGESWQGRKEMVRRLGRTGSCRTREVLHRFCTPTHTIMYSKKKRGIKQHQCCGFCNHTVGFCGDFSAGSRTWLTQSIWCLCTHFLQRSHHAKSWE